ncbi:hypothetical protein [Nostoc sp. NMS9]|uniref:hypothetical protein n=1 Tax=Nostoc sp. NMS9 TaxID=2815393 RepID=UPI0025FFF523|nr:hypothetical protein [Nostoc sp. NMS9]MBN3944923.1 hypothetical protein [Nostoc sp. NMS9]
MAERYFPKHRQSNFHSQTRILIDRVSSDGNWREVCQDLKQEAAINHSTVSELIADILKNNGLKDVFDIETVDWETFLVDESAIPTEE